MVEMDPGYHKKLVKSTKYLWAFQAREFFLRYLSSISSHFHPTPTSSLLSSDCSQASAGEPLPGPSLPAPSCAHGCRFCRANREELCMHSGSLVTDSPRDFWRASACSWSSIRLACWRSASLSSAVCLLGNRQGGGTSGLNERSFELVWLDEWMRETLLWRCPLKKCSYWPIHINGTTTDTLQMMNG